MKHMIVREIQRRYKGGERNFNQIDLSRENLAWINLTEADLSEANLSEAKLSAAILKGATLKCAILRLCVRQSLSCQHCASSSNFAC